MSSDKNIQSRVLEPQSCASVCTAEECGLVLAYQVSQEKAVELNTFARSHSLPFLLGTIEV